MAAHSSTSSVDVLPDRSTVPPPLTATVYCFSILAAAEPGVMPRVLELFSKRGLTPTRWHSDVVGPRGGELSIDIQVHGLDLAAGGYIARCLRQLCHVETVLTSQKHVGRR
ncbi:MAG TPA: acetolactate synthase small subunit [Kiloniellaceae bacterium]